MNTQKVSVTLRSGSVRRARELAGVRGLSSYLDAALQEKLERDEQQRAVMAYLQELEAENPSTPEEKRIGEEWAADIIRQTSIG